MLREGIVSKMPAVAGDLAVQSHRLAVSEKSFRSQRTAKAASGGLPGHSARYPAADEERTERFKSCGASRFGKPAIATAVIAKRVLFR
jgi:hypothetical protein